MISPNNVYNIDCLEGFKSMETESVDLIITDPPYRIPTRTKSSLLSKGMFKETLTEKGKIFEHNNILLEEYIDELYRVLKDKGHCYLFINNKHLLYFLNTISKSKFHFIKTLIWKKNIAIPNQYYRDCHEYIIFLRKGKAKNINQIGTKSILEYNIAKNKEHPCQKPIDLLETLIINSSQEREIVFDPFAGSGATLTAAKNTNRKYIGFEIDATYFNLIKGKIENE